MSGRANIGGSRRGVSLAASGQARNKVVGVDTKHDGDAGDHVQRPRTPAPLQVADLGGGDADRPGKGGLGHTPLIAGAADESSSHRVGVKHNDTLTKAGARVKCAAVDALVGRRVAEERLRRGLSQRAMAALMGLSAPRLSQLESGEAWTVSLLCDAARALGVQPEDIMQDSPRVSADEARILDALRAGKLSEAMIALGEAAIKRGAG